MTYYVTTPIYYVNAKPHLGHAYTTIVCDSLTRFHRLIGDDSFMLTGTDEHGDKIAEAAAREGCSPQVYVNYISSSFQFAWPKFSVQYDDFIRTTEERHKTAVSRFMNLVSERGDIYFGEYGGLYCVGCERFYTEKELENGLCPDHKTPPKYIAEKNYFFRMGKYQDWLIDHIKKNPDFIQPERYKNEVLSFLSEPLEDLCVSRPKSRLSWGIDIPFDHNFVTYVWFDALINYITALGWPDGEKFPRYWPSAEHVVAKDILKPHAIFWPIMLHSAGLPVYKRLNVHGYWRMEESKMSKSVGNVVDIFTLREEFGSDAIRYFLMREMNFGLDSEFSRERVLERHNADLANDFGNLWQRSATMLHKYLGGVVPATALREIAADPAWSAQLSSLIGEYKENFLRVRPQEALKKVWEFVGSLNKLIDSEAPWALARAEETRPRLQIVMATLIKGLAVIGALASPVAPRTGAELWRRLGLDPGRITLDLAEIDAGLSRGQVVEVGDPFFLRAEREDKGKKTPAPPKAKAPQAPPEGPAPEIDFAEFKRLDLKIGEILEAEPVPKSDKLLKLKVSLGAEERTIVAGIKKYFEPAELVGQRLLVVANLAPRELMGLKSHGMVLCASGEGTLAILNPSRPLPPGSPVS
ncbi:MAG: methionine--tRNA ligase [Deltaproteobacteria bacterium]|jgi:methionyl-tRNA synthetase|nr:methionine--tRNA ligase [Deltaproteobacteria bacterium]